MTKTRPKLAVWKLTSCDGCQLSLLDCEDDILDIAEAVEISHFREFTRTQIKGPYDISLVEGSVSTPAEIRRIHKIRKQSKTLVAIGACATAGGIQALKNFADTDAFINAVYAHPEYIETLETALPISEYVPVDFELRGCPIDKGQLLEFLFATLFGRKPNIPAYSQCVECKRAGTICVMVVKGEPCLGPVTQAGCGNICPSCDRGCFGCFGPSETPNTTSLSNRMAELGADKNRIRNVFRSFAAGDETFRKESESHE